MTTLIVIVILAAALCVTRAVPELFCHHKWQNFKYEGWQFRRCQKCNKVEQWRIVDLGKSKTWVWVKDPTGEGK